MRASTALVLALSSALPPAPAPAADGSRTVHERRLPEARVPNDVHLAVGVALLASSFAFKSCLRPWSSSKIPFVAFAGGAAHFLIREAFIREEYKKSVENGALAIERWETTEDAVKQVEALRASAEIERAAALASGKKARNAKVLQNAILLSAGLFVAFAIKGCASCASPLAPTCIPGYNACKRDICGNGVGGAPTNEELDREHHDSFGCPNYEPTCGAFGPPAAPPIPRKPGAPPFPLDLILPPRAAAMDAKRIGLLSAAALAGFSDALGRRIARAPALAKAAILAGLAEIARGSASRWREAEAAFEKRAATYDELADRIERSLAVRKEAPDRRRRNVVVPKSLRWNNSKRDKGGGGGPCVAGAVGSLVLDPACSCKKSGSCATMPLPSLNLSDLGTGAPPFVGATWGGIAAEGNSVFSGGETGGGNASPGQWGLNAAKLGRWLGRLVRKAGGETKEAGALRDKVQKGFRRAVLKAWNDMGPAGRASFGWGPSPMGDVDGTKGADEALEKMSEGLAGRKKARAAAASSAAKGRRRRGLFDDDAPAPPAGEERNPGGDWSGVPVNGPETSLWRIITLRHFMSAFPVIFEESPAAGQAGQAGP